MTENAASLSSLTLLILGAMKASGYGGTVKETKYEQKNLKPD